MRQGSECHAQILLSEFREDVCGMRRNDCQERRCLIPDLDLNLDLVLLLDMDLNLDQSI